MKKSRKNEFNKDLLYNKSDYDSSCSNTSSSLPAKTEN